MKYLKKIDIKELSKENISKKKNINLKKNKENK